MNFLMRMFSAIGMIIFISFYLIAMLILFIVLIFIDMYSLIKKLFNGVNDDKREDITVQNISEESVSE